jgi:hypothetical protein
MRRTFWLIIIGENGPSSTRAETLCANNSWRRRIAAESDFKFSEKSLTIKMGGANGTFNGGTEFWLLFSIQNAFVML